MSDDKKISVFGVFRDEPTMTRAVETLKTAGFSDEDISALLPDTRSSHGFACEKHTKAPEGAIAGALVGVVVGGALGVLLGLRMLGLAGLAPLAAAGPVYAALAGAGALGIVGAIIGGLVGVSRPEYEAKRYDAAFAGTRKGGALLSVHAESDDAVHRARSILDGLGATDIGTGREARVGSTSHRSSRPREQAARSR